MITSEAAHRVHDIEDLAALGRSRKACPYYLSRKWAENAELIFGPYNYLVDPVIRRSMGIDVSGAVVVFDEAHNIEDVAREAASLDLDRPGMIATHGALVQALQLNGKPAIYGPLARAAEEVLKWMGKMEAAAVKEAERNGITSQSGGRGGGRGYAGRGGGGREAPRQTRSDPYTCVRQGPSLISELASMGLDRDALDPLWECYMAAREQDEALNQGGQGQGGLPGGLVDETGQPQSVSQTGPPKKGAVRVGAKALGTLSRLVQVRGGVVL
jgi:fanconi anemia group J protein